VSNKDTDRRPLNSIPASILRHIFLLSLETFYGKREISKVIGSHGCNFFKERDCVL